jgi:hypothetical protein
VLARAGRRQRDVGERAALEVIRSCSLAGHERALLLSDNRDIGRVVVIDPDRLILLMTWDYLRQLEEVQRIQSADAVIEAVRPAAIRPHATCSAASIRKSAKPCAP